MTRAEIASFNAGVAALAEIATASAFVLRGRLTEAPTHYSFAIEALEGLAEAAGAVMLPFPPNDSEPAAAALPAPAPTLSGSAVA